MRSLATALVCGVAILVGAATVTELPTHSPTTFRLVFQSPTTRRRETIRG